MYYPAGHSTYRYTNCAATPAQRAPLPLAARLCFALPPLLILGSAIAYPVQRMTSAHAATTSQGTPTAPAATGDDCAEGLSNDPSCVGEAPSRGGILHANAASALKIMDTLEANAKANGGSVRISSADLHVLRRRLEAGSRAIQDSTTPMDR